MNDKVAACLVDVFADVNMLMLAVLCGKKKIYIKDVVLELFCPQATEASVNANVKNVSIYGKSNKWSFFDRILIDLVAFYLDPQMSRTGQSTVLYIHSLLLNNSAINMLNHDIFFKLFSLCLK